MRGRRWEGRRKRGEGSGERGRVRNEMLLVFFPHLWACWDTEWSWVRRVRRGQQQERSLATAYQMPFHIGA